MLNYDKSDTLYTKEIIISPGDTIDLLIPYTIPENNNFNTATVYSELYNTSGEKVGNDKQTYQFVEQNDISVDYLIERSDCFNDTVDIYLTFTNSMPLIIDNIRLTVTGDSNTNHIYEFLDNDDNVRVHDIGSIPNTYGVHGSEPTTNVYKLQIRRENDFIDTKLNVYIEDSYGLICPYEIEINIPPAEYYQTDFLDTLTICENSIVDLRDSVNFFSWITEFPDMSSSVDEDVHGVIYSGISENGCNYRDTLDILVDRILTIDTFSLKLNAHNLTQSNHISLNVDESTLFKGARFEITVEGVELSDDILEVWTLNDPSNKLLEKVNDYSYKLVYIHNDSSARIPRRINLNAISYRDSIYSVTMIVPSYRGFCDTVKIHQEARLLNNYHNLIRIGNTDPGLNFTASLSPNPTEGKIRLEINSPTRSGYIIDLYDLNGKHIVEVIDINGLPAGKYNTTLDLSHLSNGVYFLQIINDKGIRVTEKFIIHN
jgi:hypothetical protein